MVRPVQVDAVGIRRRRPANLDYGSGSAKLGHGYHGNVDSGFQAQALWLDRTLPSLVDLGARRAFWFQLDENLYAPSGFGLLGPDLMPRPAYSALRSLTNQYI